jgi:hypothetical protein
MLVACTRDKRALLRTIAIAGPSGALAGGCRPCSGDAGRCGALAAVQGVPSALSLHRDSMPASAPAAVHKAPPGMPADLPQCKGLARRPPGRSRVSAGPESLSLQGCTERLMLT